MRTKTYTETEYRYQLQTCKADGEWFPVPRGFSTEALYRHEYEAKRRMEYILRMASTRPDFPNGFPIKKFRIVEYVTTRKVKEETRMNVQKEESTT